MSFEVTIVRQEIQLENYPDYCEASGCDDPNCSFYGSLGLGLIEILLRSHSCHKFSCNMFNVIQENISKIDEIILNKGLDKERKIFCQLVDLMNYTEYPRSQLTQWLHCYMNENRDSAVTSMITMIQLITYNLCKTESFAEEILNLSTPLPQSTFEKIIKIICENFPVHIKILSKDTKVYYRLGTNTFPVINLYKSDNSSYLLLYNRDVVNFDNGSDKEVNIFVEPFVETHTGVKIHDKPKPNMNLQNYAFKLENNKEGQIVIPDEHLTNSISILPPGPKAYAPEAMKAPENTEREEFKGRNNEKNCDNKVIGSEDDDKNEMKFKPSSNLDFKQNPINQGPNDFLNNFMKTKDKDIGENEGKIGNNPRISIPPRNQYQSAGNIPIVSNPPMPIPVPTPNFIAPLSGPKVGIQVPQIPINFLGIRPTKENPDQSTPKQEIQFLKNTNQNDNIKTPPIKENSLPQKSALPPSVVSPPNPLNFQISPPMPPGSINSENKIPLNTKFPPQNFMTANNEFSPKTRNQNIPGDKNSEISAKVQVVDPSDPRKFFKAPDLNSQTPHQIKPPGAFLYPNAPGLNTPNTILGKDDKPQIPYPGDQLKNVPKDPTPVTPLTVPKILTPTIASTVPVVTHCPLPGQQVKNNENPFPPQIPKIQPIKNPSQQEVKIFSSPDPQVKQDPYHIESKPNNYNPIPSKLPIPSIQPISPMPPMQPLLPIPPIQPQPDSSPLKQEISQNYVSFGPGNTSSQQSPFVHMPVKPEIQRQKTPDNFSGTFNIPNPNTILPPSPYVRNDKDTPSFSANEHSKIIPPAINFEPPNISKNYIPPGSFGIPMPSNIADQFGRPHLPDYANRPRFDRKLLDIVGIMSEIITSGKSDYRNMLEKISRIIDGDSELANIESLMSLENYRKLKMNIIGTGKIRCGVCRLDKDRDDFSIINCKEDNCKCCSKCRTVDISKGCPCCTRIYSDYEIDLLNVAKVSLVQ